MAGAGQAAGFDSVTNFLKLAINFIGIAAKCYSVLASKDERTI